MFLGYKMKKVLFGILILSIPIVVFYLFMYGAIKTGAISCIDSLDYLSPVLPQSVVLQACTGYTKDNKTHPYMVEQMCKNRIGYYYDPHTNSCLANLGSR